MQLLIRLIRGIWRSRNPVTSPAADGSGTRAAEFETLRRAGVSAYENGRLEEAGRLIASALKIDSRSTEAHSNLGVVLASQKRHAEALASFDTALAISPGYVEALYVAAVV